MSSLPTFKSLLKSRDVEDPINIGFNRPLAYLFVKLVYRTPITPNQVTLLAMTVGIIAGVFMSRGTDHGMLVGGILLWASAILDGADGILARAKQMQSALGRALDGSADMVVAIATVIPAYLHLWNHHHSKLYLILGLPTIVTAIWHIAFYDFYKELYMANTRPGRGREGEDLEKTRQRITELKSSGANFIVIFAMERVFLPFIESQRRLIRRTNAPALTSALTRPATEASASTYRRLNLKPMRLWTYISLAPHNYLLAICAMFNRIDLYLWTRFGLMNVVMLAAILMQRRATSNTLREAFWTDGQEAVS